MPSRGLLLVVLALLSHTAILALASPTNTTRSTVAEPAVDDNRNLPTTVSGQTLRASLGRRIGQEGFNPVADLNRDGVVNVLDAALLRLREGVRRNIQAKRAVRVAGTDQIIIEPVRVNALPGQQVAVLFLIRGNTTPLLGYTLDVTATASGGAIGAVVSNVSATNFFDSRNVITAGGSTRDPLFSVIEGDGAGGLSITALTGDLTTVLAVDNVNDVLAEVLFDVPPGAEGEFVVTLGSGSAISDMNGSAIPFTFLPGTIRVFNPAEVPVVSEWGMIVMSLLLVVAGWVVLARRAYIAGAESG